MLSARLAMVAAMTTVPALSIPATSASAGDLAGVWMTDDGEGAVEFGPCGANARCGRIVWMKKPLGDDGKPQLDVNNPNAAARDKPVCGAQIFRNLQPQADGSWDNGTVYDPEEGKTYSVAVTVKADGKLEVTGYLGTKMLGETRVWGRGQGILTKCVRS